MTRRPWSKDRAWECAFRPIELAPASLRRTLEAFFEWLRTHRGMQPGSVRVRLASVREFLRRIGGVANAESPLASLGALDLERFFVSYASEAGPAALRNMRSAVRLFLLFANECGWVGDSLAEAVPSVRTQRLAHVVRGIPDAAIRELLASFGDERPADIRDRAILVILATYGVRRGQLCNLLLGDIDWRNGLIRFPSHKGGKTVVQRLLAEVADPLARYLTRVRPESDHQEIFLRLIPPCSPLSPGAVCTMVSERLNRANVKCEGRSPHAFRHAFATRQLRQGCSLKEVADQLGHRHLASASLYTKVDQPALREVAVEWPEVTR